MSSTQKNSISICICTINTPDHLYRCLQSIMNSHLLPYEIIIVDQSNINNTRKNRDVVARCNTNLIRYVKDNSVGLSRARNIAIGKTTGTIVAFTDQDCIVHPNWIESIERTFQSHPSIYGIFGTVYPYRPKKHRHEICPCTFTRRVNKIIRKPCRHWLNIGFGNNMAYRKSIFSLVGPFGHWIGPKSIGLSADDAEMALRCLVKGYPLMHNARTIVYHNRWETPMSIKFHELYYTGGEMACYGYFAAQGYRVGKEVVARDIRMYMHELKNTFVGENHSQSLRVTYFTVIKFFFLLRGLIVGLWYGIMEPIT